MQPQQNVWPWLLQSRPLVEPDPTGRTAGPGTGLTYVAKLAHDAMPADIETCKRMMVIRSNLHNANMNEAFGEIVEEPPPKKKKQEGKFRQHLRRPAPQGPPLERLLERQRGFNLCDDEEPHGLARCPQGVPQAI